MRDTDIPFSVSFTHRLRHTTDVCGADFGALTDLLQTDGAASRVQPAKVLLWVDSNLHQDGDADAPSFASRLSARLAQNENVELVASPHAIPG